MNRAIPFDPVPHPAIALRMRAEILLDPDGLLAQFAPGFNMADQPFPELGRKQRDDGLTERQGQLLMGA